MERNRGFNPTNDKFIQINEDKDFVEKSGFDDVQIYGDNDDILQIFFSWFVMILW